MCRRCQQRANSAPWAIARAPLIGLQQTGSTSGDEHSDGPESQDDVPPGKAKTPDEVLEPGEEAEAEAEAQDVEDRTEAAADAGTERTD